MRFSADARRTNTIRHYPDQRILVKRYRTMPPSVLGQVVCGLRPIRALRAQHRWRTEKDKVERLRQIGFPLPFEYRGFYTDWCARDTFPGKSFFALIERKANFVTVEDRLRSGIPMAEACALVGRTAGVLRDFHVAGRTAQGTLTHGDPYLENFVVMENSIGPYDFEHEHVRNGAAAIRLDQLIFFWHAVNVLTETGHLTGRAEFEALIDAVHTGYPDLEFSTSALGPRQRIYFRLRFGDAPR